MTGRRGFLNSLFISPAVAAERLKQQELAHEQNLHDEQVRRVIREQEAAKQLGVSADKLRPRCEICDSVLINGKCQHTKKCNFCTADKWHNGEVLDYDPPVAVRVIDGKQITQTEYYDGAIDVYTHVVEGKCSVCNNAPYVPAPIFNQNRFFPISMPITTTTCSYSINYGSSHDGYDFLGRKY